MLVTELPPLPAVSVLDGNLLETVILCRFVSLAGKSRIMDHSQRQVLSDFNRSGHKVVNRCLTKAQEKGILTLKTPSYGVIPDVYIRGDFFSRDSKQSRALVTLSGSLWGKRGLLRNWPFPAAWGHGCIPPAAIICLAALSALEESISRKSLHKYLSTLTAESSFNAALRFLNQRYLTFCDSERILIAPDWKEKFQRILDEKPECNERKARGDARRKAESQNNKVRARHGRLTDAERNQLLKLPCVVKGCKRKSHVQEHFPPKKFLKENLEVVTNRHFVWSICRQHNREMADFIKKMPDLKPLIYEQIYIASGVDSLRLYRGCANYWIIRFYDAYRANDIFKASYAVRAVLGCWTRMTQSSSETEIIGPNQRIIRRAVGKQSYSPARSQLPYRTEERQKELSRRTNLDKKGKDQTLP
jgi:hypothetical protein